MPPAPGRGRRSHPPGSPPTGPTSRAGGAGLWETEFASPHLHSQRCGSGGFADTGAWRPPPCTPAARPAQTKQRLPTRPFAPAPGRSTLPPPPAQEAPAGRSIGVFQSIGGPICSNGCSPCLVLRWPQAKADRSTPHGHPPRVQRPEPPLQPCWNAPRSTRTNNGSSISRPGGGGGHEGGGGGGGQW